MHGEEEVQMFSPIPTWMLGAPSGFLHGAMSPQGPSTPSCEGAWGQIRNRCQSFAS